MTLEDGIEIHLKQIAFLMDFFAAWNDFQSVELGFSFDTAVGFNHSHDYIDAFQQLAPRDAEHFVSFANAWRCTEKDFETTALLALSLR
jgi:hypothetical protein